MITHCHFVTLLDIHVPGLFLNGTMIAKEHLIPFNPLLAELSVTISHHLKLELLTQFPASNDEKYFCFATYYFTNVRGILYNTG